MTSAEAGSSAGMLAVESVTTATRLDACKGDSPALSLARTTVLELNRLAAAPYFVRTQAVGPGEGTFVVGVPGDHVR